MSGVLCVMTSGEMLMLLWCADSWATTLKVINDYFVKHMHLLLICILLQQIHLSLLMLTLVLALVQSTWTMLNAVQLKVNSWTAHIAHKLTVHCTHAHASEATTMI